VIGWCSSPQRLVCIICNEWHLVRCKSSRSSKCGHCAELKRLDVASIGRSGWTDRPTDRGYWVTLTAPGQSVLPWDRRQCRHSGGVVCGGERGCVVDAQALAIWHDGMGMRWSHWVTAVRRALGPSVTVDFFKTYEPQQRGALHIHAMVRVSGAVAAKRVETVMRWAASRSWIGFGRQATIAPVDLSDGRSVARTAGYCAKYASKSADALPDVLRLNAATGEVRHGGLRSWSASRSWGDTMRCINIRRRAWAAGAATSGATQLAACTAGAAGAGGALDLNQKHYAGSDQGAGLIDSVAGTCAV